MREENENEDLAPCERFTLLESRRSQNLLRCDVCDHIADAHPDAGRRILTGAEVEELRRRRLIARFENMREERKAQEQAVPSANGSNTASPESSE
jgi:hypothetical protein